MYGEGCVSSVTSSSSSSKKSFFFGSFPMSCMSSHVALHVSEMSCMIVGPVGSGFCWPDPWELVVMCWVCWVVGGLF